MSYCCGGSDISLSPTGGWVVTTKVSCFSDEAPSTGSFRVSPEGIFSSFSSPSEPSTGSAIDESDAYIADALRHMTIEERDALYHELHGVADVVPETPEFLKESYKALRDELHRISTQAATPLRVRAFQMAEKENFDYVHSKFHYKAFLRAERFDVKAAATRMIKFFDYKENSFGLESLCKDVTQEMLSAEDLQVYRKGADQVLPCRDKMGRCICVMFPNLMGGMGTPDRMRRLQLYEAWSLIQDEETQRKGATVVVVVGPRMQGELDTKPLMDIRMLRVSTESITSLPIRYAVVHNCFSDIQWKMIMGLGLKLVGRDIRARNKIHFGAMMECAYSLMGFGIPPGCLPIDSNGYPKTKQHIDFIKMRRAQEKLIEQGKLKSPSTSDDNDHNVEGRQSPDRVIVIPGTADVLLGRGRPIQSHPGNAELTRLVDEAIPEYESRRKLEKTQLTFDMVDHVKVVLGGRFLKQDPSSGVWQVTTDEEARLKVSHLFRARRDSVLQELAKQQKLQRDARNDASNDMPPPGKRARIGVESGL